MTPDREGGLAPAPLETLVLKELRKLRQRIGLTKGRVKRLGVVISALPIVDGELSRYPELTRASAAYQVIRCSVLYWIANPDFRRILIRTMNIDNNGPGNLTDRQQSIMLEFNISVFNNFLNLEDDAYEELATVLMTLQKSPCDGGRLVLEDIRALAEESVRKYGQDTIKIEVPAAPIVEVILRWLTNIENDALARDLTAALIGYVGWSAVDPRFRRRDTSNPRLFWRLFDAASFGIYGDLPLDDFLPEQALVPLFDPFYLWSWRMSERQVLIDHQRELLTVIGRRDIWINLDYYRRKANTVRLVAEWLLRDRQPV